MESKKTRNISVTCFLLVRFILCSFNSAGFQARSTYMKSFGSSVYRTFYVFNIGIPNSVWSSMRMAYVVTEMNAFTTNITFSHLDTSSKCIRISLFFRDFNSEICSQHWYINRNYSGLQVKTKDFWIFKNKGSLF